MRKLIFVCILVIFSLTTVFGMSVSAVEKTSASDKIFAISAGGDASKFAPYSTEAIESSIDLGFDAVSVKLDEIGEDGFDVEKLQEILTTADGRITVILDCNENNLEEAFAIADEYENVYFRARDIKAKNLIAWAEEKDNRISVIPSYNGNVIFSAVSIYNSAENSSYDFCEFSSKNRYGVIFSEFFANRFEGTKALMSLSEKDFSGQRNDSIHGWESVISLGYSAIETDNEREFAKYISLLDESYNQLETVYNEAKEADLTPYSSSSTKNFEKHVKLASEMLTSEKPSSQREINECIESIENSYSEFQLSEGEEDNKTFSVTPMKIFWIAFAIALFLSSQIYLHKKTQKS